jgi:hypothetical protein
MAKGLLPVLFLLITSAHAYNFVDDFDQGFYWNSIGIDLKVVEPDPNAGALLKAVVENAANAWNQALGQQLFTVDPTIYSSNPGGNIIRWSYDIGAETNFDPSQTLAVTLRWIEYTHYTRTAILLNAQLPSMSQLNTMQDTMLHELGHTYGLGHSDNYNAVMYYQYVGTSALTSDDVNGMSALVLETQRRQAERFISPLATEGETRSTALSCGTVDLNSGDGPGGPMSVLLSLALGLLVTYRPRKRKTLPVKVTLS